MRNVKSHIRSIGSKNISTGEHIMINSLKKFGVLVVFGLFCLLYQPPVLNFNIIHVVGIASWLYILLVSNVSKGVLTIDKTERTVFTCFIFISLYVFFDVVLLLGGTLALAFSSFYCVIDIIPFCVVLKNIGRRKRCTTEDFINLFIFTASLQAVMVFAAIVFPPVQSFFIQKLVDYGYTTDFSRFSSYRIYGFAASLTFITPIVQSFVAVLCFLKGTKSKAKLLYYTLGTLLFASGVVNARIAIVVLVIGFSAYVFWGKAPIIRKIAFLVAIFVGSYLLINLVFPFLAKQFPATYNWIYSGVDELENAFRGNFTQGYFSYITSKEKYTLPSDVLNIIFGKGYRIMGGRALYGVSSDIGFINDIWLGGLFYCIIVYTVYFGFMKSMYKSKDSLSSFIGLFFILTFIICNFKGYVFTMNGLTNMLLVFYFGSESLVKWQMSDRKSENVRIIDDGEGAILESTDCHAV